MPKISQKMPEVIKIKKGFNIRIKGKAEKVYFNAKRAEEYAVKPTDFYGIIPKMLVEEGETVKTGAPLFHDKNNQKIIFTSPVSGHISRIVRGEQRKILEIVIKASEADDYINFNANDPVKLNREEIIEKLLISGIWPFIRQRPYSIIANPSDIPKSIFISAFDTSPLAPDIDFIVRNEDENFQTGINALAKLTNGKIHLNVNANYPVASIFAKTKGVEINYFKGPHPAGNVGIQIHHIDPINKGDIVWYLYPQDVIIIGKLFNKGIFDSTRIIAVTGSEIIKPKYYKCNIGINITELTRDNVKQGNNRYISGNVLTGTKIAKDGFLSFYDSQLTVIPEGNYHEFLGWLRPGFHKYSFSRTFFSWLTPDREYRLDTNTHGGQRAFVMTGQYEKVLPMDIYPMQLLKAIMIEDIDLMEKLGIYEVSEEDFALCEFICTSKYDIMNIIRKGLDLVRKEMS